MNGSLKIGVSMSTQGNSFYGTMVETFESYAKELGVEIIVANADGDLQKQVQGIEDLVAQGIDALIINPFEANAFVDTITSIREKGIPVVTVDNDVSEDTPVNAAVLTDNFGNGEAAGQKLVEIMGNTPIKALMVSGDPGSYVGQLRRDGLVQGIVEEQLAKYGKTQFEIVYQIYIEDWSHDEAVIQIEQNAAAHDFNVILTESDEFLYVSKDVLKAMNKWDNVYMAASADGSKNVLGAVVNGEMNVASATNNPISLAKGAVDVAIKLINGEDVARDQLTPVQLFYDAESAGQYYDPNSQW